MKGRTYCQGHRVQGKPRPLNNRKLDRLIVGVGVCFVVDTKRGRSDTSSLGNNLVIVGRRNLVGMNGDLRLRSLVYRDWLVRTQSRVDGVQELVLSIFSGSSTSNAIVLSGCRKLWKGIE